MLSVAYLANQFPSAVEPYVGEEIEELRRRGVRVIAGSVSPVAEQEGRSRNLPDVVICPLRASLLLRGFLLFLRRWAQISRLLLRIFLGGHEGPVRRMKALFHTGLGVCYAVQLRERYRPIRQIHAHHGYAASWIAMTASRLLGCPFSMTLHGSDLLLHGDYLDLKLRYCSECFTISDFNRRYLLRHYPAVDPKKVIVARLGVEVKEREDWPCAGKIGPRLCLLAVGRLHAVKDHAFLVRACAQLQAHAIGFECSIAGDGPERKRLESLISRYGLEERVTLLGHVPRQQMDSLYARADIVVLTSRSEGIPLVLMEAMSRGKVVLAPAITGIPELVVPGQTGFLYQPGSLGDFVARLLSIHSLLRSSAVAQARSEGSSDLCSDLALAVRQLAWVRFGARVQVLHNFNRRNSLKLFADALLHRLRSGTETIPHENPLLQQIQLPLQRYRGLPVRTDGSDALTRARSGAVLHV
jgi:glycosyltransferase involved in cell wall biosynthesis